MADNSGSKQKKANDAIQQVSISNSLSSSTQNAAKTKDSVTKPPAGSAQTPATQQAATKPAQSSAASKPASGFTSTKAPTGLNDKPSVAAGSKSVDAQTKPLTTGSKDNQAKVNPQTSSSVKIDPKAAPLTKQPVVNQPSTGKSIKSAPTAVKKDTNKPAIAPAAQSKDQGKGQQVKPAPKTAPSGAKVQDKAGSATAAKKQELSGKVQLSDQLRQQIDYQHKVNGAIKWKFKIFGIATLFMALILAVQVIQSDSQLRKLFTWQKMQKETVTIIEQTGKSADKTLTDTKEWINEKYDQAQKYAVDSSQSCADVRVELSKLQAEVAAGGHTQTRTIVKEVKQDCPKAKPCVCPDARPSKDCTPCVCIGGSEQSVKKDVASLQAYLAKFLNPIIDLLPNQQSKPIKSRKKSIDLVAEGIEDVVAQAIYLDKHLSKVLKDNFCGIEMQCMGQNFGKSCIVSKSVLNRDEFKRYELLLNSISVEVGWRSAKEIFQEKCQVKTFLKNLSEKAQKVNSVGESAGIAGCEPSFDLLNGHHEESLSQFLSVLFHDSEDQSKC